MGSIAIQVAGEYLTLNPNTVLELEEENPFIQLGDSVQGQYSLPFSVPATEINVRLLDYTHLLNSKKSTEGKEAVLFVDGMQHSRGRIKVEMVDGNIVQPGLATISLYYLFGVSDFFKVVENLDLGMINYGPDISFPMGSTEAPAAGTFFDHLNKVMNAAPNTYDYAFIPILNRSGLSTYDTVDTILNNFINEGMIQAYYQTHKLVSNVSIYRNEFCPFPYLKKVLQKVFEHVGWQITGDILNDPDFARIILLHNKYIPWVGVAAGQPITWNMRDHVPFVKVPAFLVAIQNRFGLSADFDYRKKVCTLRYRNDILKNRQRQDITAKVGARYSGKINAAAKVFALQQGGGNSAPDLTQFIDKGTKNNYFDLPVASAIVYKHLYFVRGENAYWACLLNDQDAYEWTRLADNTFDYTPANKTDDINTNAIIPPMVRYQLYKPAFAHWDSTQLWGVMPDVTIQPDEGQTDTFYLCYHHPVISTVNNASLGDVSIPYGSPGCHDQKGNLVATKAISWEYPEGRGLYVNNWSYFLQLLGQWEEVTIPVQFTNVDLFSLSYTDTVIIRNAEYLIKNPHFTLPLKEFCKAELIRV